MEEGADVLRKFVAREVTLWNRSFLCKLINSFGLQVSIIINCRVLRNMIHAVSVSVEK